MSKKVPKITLHWGMAKAMWPSQRGSARGGQRSTTGHKTHPNNNHCHAHSSESYNMGWAPLDRYPLFVVLSRLLQVYAVGGIG